SAPAGSRSSRARRAPTSSASAPSCTRSCARSAPARGAGCAPSSSAPARARELERLALALGGHDPQRTLERGYALVTDGDGAPVTSAEAARRLRALRLRFADGGVEAEVKDP